ncbi:DUF262 domain-containing HNH endonuclease family protein [Streptosporangium sp. NPDC051023]|uniref:DUF262 domain-containing protein n=1 Tax=Streptosporangium sp. NPDC051023 TaxID=3155410 RepID=UPI00344C789F
MPPRGRSASSVKPSSLPVGELLEKRSPFRVPKYQRPYAWDAEKVGEFIDDILALLSKGESDHFFGSMVAIQVADHSQASTQAHEVVDGQQRLTTFCLLVAQIINSARALEQQARDIGDEKLAMRLEIFAEETSKKYLFYERYDVEQGEKTSEPRLQLSNEDNTKFRALLNGVAKSVDIRDSHRLLQAAYELIQAKLISTLLDAVDDVGEKFKELQRLRDSILLDTFIIHIVSEDRQSGYRLFSVLNDRGKRLAVADLLRSHTLEQLDRFPVLQDKASRQWDEILAEGSTTADGFLKAYLPSVTGSRLSAERLFNGLKKQLFGSAPTNQDQADALAKRIEKLAEEFHRFLLIDKGVWPYDESNRSPGVSEWYRARLRRLIIVLKHELSMPLLLAASSCVDEKRFAELVHMLEKFAFRYKNICDGHASAASKHYYVMAKTLRASVAGSPAPSWEPLMLELRKLINERAPKEKFKTQLIEKLRYDHPTQRGNIREFLTTIDDYWTWLRQGGQGSPKFSSGVVVDIEQVTIEHIYPQNPPAMQKNAVLEDLKHRLGNLSYWDPRDNVTAGNKPFSEKKAQFLLSKSSMTQALGSLPAWDAGQYNSRLRSLLDDACKVFVI